MFVNAIDTFPALALSELVLYFSWPSGFASILRAPDGAVVPAVLDGVAVDSVLEDVALVVGVLAGVVADVLVLLDPPQPASASSPSASASDGTDRVRRVFA
jgi:hypothetical protein